MRTYQEIFIGTPRTTTSTQPQAQSASAELANTISDANVGRLSQSLSGHQRLSFPAVSPVPTQAAAITPTADIDVTTQTAPQIQDGTLIEAPLTSILEIEIKQSVSQSAKGHCKCGIPGCTKVFRDLSFWRKHVDKAHRQWLEELKVRYMIRSYFSANQSRLQCNRYHDLKHSLHQSCD